MTEEDLTDALDRYHQFIDELKPYPEWNDKVVEEVGKWFHMIHNNLAESDSKREIFARLVDMRVCRTVRNTLYDQM